MSAGDKVQIGVAMKVEFGSFAFVGYVATSVSNSRTAEVNTVKDERGAALTHIISNPGRTLTVNCMIKGSASAGITPPAVGTYVSLTAPDDTYPGKYILATPATITHGTEVTTLSLNLMREDSMSAVYNTSATLNVSAANYDLSDDTLSSALTISFNDATAVTSITSDAPATLTPTTHWSVSGTTLTITATYLNSVLTNPADDIVLTINFNVGNSVTLTITAIA